MYFPLIIIIKGGLRKKKKLKFTETLLKFLLILIPMHTFMSLLALVHME